MEWTDVVHGLVEEFGKDVVMVPALLEFLRVLPEEVANPKITITVSTLFPILMEGWWSTTGQKRACGRPGQGWVQRVKEGDVELELTAVDCLHHILLS